MCVKDWCMCKEAVSCLFYQLYDFVCMCVCLHVVQIIGIKLRYITSGWCTVLCCFLTAYIFLCTSDQIILLYGYQCKTWTSFDAKQQLSGPFIVRGTQKNVQKVLLLSLKGYCTNLVLHFHKVGGLARDRFLKERSKSKKQRQRYPVL